MQKARLIIISWITTFWLLKVKKHYLKCQNGCLGPSNVKLFHSLILKSEMNSTTLTSTNKMNAVSSKEKDMTLYKSTWILEEKKRYSLNQVYLLKEKLMMKDMHFNNKRRPTNSMRQKEKILMYMARKGKKCLKWDPC